MLVVAFALGAFFPYGGEKSGEPAREDTWRIQVKWETAEPGAVPTKDGTGGDDALSATQAHGDGDQRPFSLTAEYERR